MLFMLVILLLWIHPVTDQHPTGIVTNISHCFMATALILYSRAAHAFYLYMRVGMTSTTTNKKCAGICIAEPVSSEFLSGAQRGFLAMTEQKCHFRNISR